MMGFSIKRKTRMEPSSNVPEGFKAFAEWLQLTAGLTQHFYEALRTCGDREATSILYHLDKFAARRSQAGMMRMLVKFSLGCGHPHRLIALVEKLTERGLLSRLEASALEEKLFARMRATDGMWR
jgi:hypothetical protein